MALPDFIKRLRNRLVADPKFIAFAQRFPLTRPVARRQSIELFDLLAGFAYSQTLAACVDLNVLGLVKQRGLTVPELAAKTGLPSKSAQTLAGSAVALGILDRADGLLIPGRHGAALLAQPWIMKFVAHHRHFYKDLADPVALLNGEFAAGGLRDYWRYDQSGEGKADYSALMAASQEAVSEQVLRAYDFSRHQSVLDVGGGTGAFLRAVGQRHPNLKLALFDLPGVAALGEKASDGITRHGGDFRHGPLPSGHDLICLVRVAHDHDDEDFAMILKSIRKACSSDTILLIAEPFAGNASTARITDAYFNLYFAAMGQGRTRSPQEIAAIAEKAGFSELKVLSTDMPMISGVITLRPNSVKS